MKGTSKHLRIRNPKAYRALMNKPEGVPVRVHCEAFYKEFPEEYLSIGSVRQAYNRMKKEKVKTNSKKISKPLEMVKVVSPVSSVVEIEGIKVKFPKNEAVLNGITIKW